MSTLNATGRLFAEVIALRIVLQRLLGQMAAQSGDFDGVLKKEHAAAMDDLSRMHALDDDPARGQAILMHAEQSIDQIYTVLRQGTPPRQS